VRGAELVNLYAISNLAPKDMGQNTLNSVNNFRTGHFDYNSQEHPDEG